MYLNIFIEYIQKILFDIHEINYKRYFFKSLFKKNFFFKFPTLSRFYTRNFLPRFKNIIKLFIPQFLDQALP